MLSSALRTPALKISTLLVFPLALIGCGLSPAPDSPILGPQLRGSVFGGQQPISGATIQLFAAGTSNYGAGAQSLLNSPVTTGTDGSFTLTGDYTCPSATSELYLLSSGGNPGFATPTNNTSLVLMAALGSCALHNGTLTLDPNLYITVNEVTTVASVYALAGFMDPITTQVGATSTNLTGITNAFNTVTNLVTLATGAAILNTPTGNFTAPQAEINSLANSLAPCVDSNGADGTCTALFAATTFNSVVPTNTLQAVLSVANHPASQANTIYKLASLTPPFAPFVPATPALTNWIMPILYTAYGSYQFGIAIDASGDAWISNEFTSNTNLTSSITELSPTGAILSGTAGFTGGGLNRPYAIAIDPTGYVWLANTFTGQVSKFTSAGSPVPTSPFAGGGNGYALAIDGYGDVWLPNNELDTNGNLLRSLPVGSNTAYANSVDTSENVWIAEQSGPSLGDVLKLSNNGSLVSPAAGYKTTTMPSARTMANDNAGDGWSCYYGSFSSAVIEIDKNGNFLSGPNGFQSGGISSTTPAAIAIDGAGSAWLAGGTTSIGTQVFELDKGGNVLSGSTGFAISNASYPIGIAIDGSGNVWLSEASNYVIELIGAATPTVTPLSLGVKNGTLATRP